jgi:hypothetical protein
MDFRNDLLEKLLSYDVMQVVIAIGTLNDHAKKGETWPLEIMNAAIKRRAGKENVEFYNFVPTIHLRPKELHIHWDKSSCAICCWKMSHIRRN